jgi:hypothetical protein
MKDWEIIADNWVKPVGVGAGSQPLIRRGERSGLLTRIATMGRRFIVHADEKLSAFLELESATGEASGIELLKRLWL